MTIDYVVNGVSVKLSEEDYRRIKEAEDQAQTRKILQQYGDERKALRAPLDQYIVCEWDPSNPEKSIPCQVAGPYKIKGFAFAYARRMNEKPQPKFGEADYFVMDNKGNRVY